MHSLQWSPQKAERRALERDEKAIQRWKQKDWPRIKKKRYAAGCPYSIWPMIRLFQLIPTWSRPGLLKAKLPSIDIAKGDGTRSPSFQEFR